MIDLIKQPEVLLLSVLALLVTTNMMTWLFCVSWHKRVALAEKKVDSLEEV